MGFGKFGIVPSFPWKRESDPQGCGKCRFCREQKLARCFLISAFRLYGELLLSLKVTKSLTPVNQPLRGSLRCDAKRGGDRRKSFRAAELAQLRFSSDSPRHNPHFASHLRLIKRSRQIYAGCNKLNALQLLRPIQAL